MTWSVRGKDDLNILILSCGTRNKIVQYFKRELAGRGVVVATDCSELAPALYEADQYYIVPRIDAEEYLDVILNICRENSIKAVLSLIDPELSLLAKHRDLFVQLGVIPMVSDYEVVELCLDKYKMASFLSSHGYLSAKSYISKEEFFNDVDAGQVSYPVFVKPVKGSASVNVSKVGSKKEVELLFTKFDDLMIQEFMDGTELGADVYIDMLTGEPVSIFTKEKLKMRSGETDKSVSIKDERLFHLIVDLSKTLGLKGVVDIDIFRIGGEYYISEINPRFGGGYPHAHECGANMVDMLLRNVRGEQNAATIGHYDEDICMLKYSDVRILRLSES
mgnify:FL=1|jgi:carbamoyl-phosphate synthase large subunit